MKFVINIAHNRLTSLFNEIKYEINLVEVQWVKKPGITNILKGYCSYTSADLNYLQNATWDDVKKNKNVIKMGHSAGASNQITFSVFVKIIIVL